VPSFDTWDVLLPANFPNLIPFSFKGAQVYLPSMKELKGQRYKKNGNLVVGLQ